MVGLNINYALLRINNFTDKTALNFLKVYLAAGSDCVLHSSNKYYKEACDLIAGASTSYLSSNSSFRSSKAKLQFEESELGTSYEKLRHMVVRNVTTSSSRTAVRLSAGSGSGPRKAKYESKLMSTGMGAIQEDEDDQPPEVKLEVVRISVKKLYAESNATRRYRHSGRGLAGSTRRSYWKGFLLMLAFTVQARSMT